MNKLAVDISVELLEKIQATFQKKFGTSQKAQNLLRKTNDGLATYADANEFSIITGDLLAEAFAEHLSSDVLPNGRLYYNIGQKVVAPMLENNYEIVADNAVTVQETLNALAGIGIKGQRADIQYERIEGIIQRLANELNYDDVAWILKEPVVNFTQAVVDDTIKKNVEFHNEAGLKAKVVRIAESKACEWCRNLQGEYDYPDVPQDVWHRHQNDKCIITYYPKKGKAKIVPGPK